MQTLFSQRSVSKWWDSGYWQAVGERFNSVSHRINWLSD